MNPLVVAKLKTSEDDGIHEGLQRLAVADTIAADIVIEGAMRTGCGDWARITAFVEQHAETMTSSNARWWEEVAIDWAYYVGLAVGLRLARAVNVPHAAETVGDAR